MVNIVEVEFNIDANELTMAAAKAAKASPFKPTGKNCKIYLSGQKWSGKKVAKIA